MPLADLIINEQLRIPAAELSWAAARASGAGGQNVNKVSSKVELRFSVWRASTLSWPVKRRLEAASAHRMTGDGILVITSQVHRDQSQNLREVLDRLRELIRDALVEPKLRTKTKPTKSSKRRRLDGKKLQGEKKRERRSGFDD